MIPSLARLLLLILASAGLALGLAVGTRSAEDRHVVSFSERILAGEIFSAQTLERQAARAEALSGSAACGRAHRAAAVIAVRLAEDALSRADPLAFDAASALARRTAEKALTCFPRDAYLWLARYWLDSLTSGVADAQALALSYRFAPREPWVAVNRARVVAPLFDNLPPDLQRAAAAELGDLVEFSLYGPAMMALERGSAGYRRAAGQALAGVTPTRAAILFRQMRRSGAALTDLPTEVPELRPWTRPRP